MTHPFLDDPDRFRQIDLGDVLGIAERSPEQFQRAVAIAEQFIEDLAVPSGITSVVLLGMGGSAISGDFLAAFVDRFGKIPFRTVRDYVVPGWCGPATLVLAASYSGHTEETCSATREAIARGCPVISLSSGGELQEIASDHGFPHCRIESGMPPRMATAMIFIPFLAVLVRAGVLPESVWEEMKLAVSRMGHAAESWSRNISHRSNRAKQLAVRLHGRIPVFYGSAGYLAAMGVRWKSQLNENAKVHAFANQLPEWNHNEIIGWEGGRDQSRIWSVVHLRDSGEESASLKARVRFSRDIIGDAADQMEVWATGQTYSDRFLNMLLMGDYLSIYLALLRGADPSVIRGIDRLKEALGATRNARLNPTE